MTRDPLEVLHALAPRLPLDPDALDRVRARLDAEGSDVPAGHLEVVSAEGGGTAVAGVRRGGAGAARRSRRWVSLAVAAAAVSTVFVLLPRPDQQAVASWTPRGAVIPADQAADLVADCVARTFRRDPGDEWEKPWPAPSDLASARLVLGERRGASEFVVAEVAGWTAYCSAGEGGGVSAGLPADRELDMPGTQVDLLLGGGHMSELGALFHWMGAAGPEVAAVEVLLDDGREVVATLGGGRFVAWWPSTRTTRDVGDGHEAELGLEGAAVRVTMLDGTTRTVPAEGLLRPAERP